jgi:predicted permease
VVEIDARGTPYQSAGILHLLDPLLNRIRALPGVRAAAMSSSVPVFGGNIWIERVRTNRYVAAPDEDAGAFVNPVTPGFFAAAGIALRRGRDFTPADREGTDPVAIVSETFARKYFPQGDAVGDVLHLSECGGPGSLRERLCPERSLRIVAVAADARFTNLREPERPLIYLPVLQQPRTDGLVLSVRTAGAPVASAALIREQIEAVAPGLTPRRMLAMEQAIDEALLRERLAALLATLFGTFALGLAALGLYGIIAYAVAGRTVEIGTRMALGARRIGVLWLVLRQSVLMLAVGFAAGVPLALLAARALGTQLYGVRSFDPLSLGAAVVVLGAAGLIASWLPARRATRIDPLTALRSS